jgi:hypothetical protein
MDKIDEFVDLFLCECSDGRSEFSIQVQRMTRLVNTFDENAQLMHVKGVEVHCYFGLTHKPVL